MCVRVPYFHAHISRRHHAQPVRGFTKCGNDVLVTVVADIVVKLCAAGASIIESKGLMLRNTHDLVADGGEAATSACTTCLFTLRTSPLSFTNP